MIHDVRADHVHHVNPVKKTRCLLAAAVVERTFLSVAALLSIGQECPRLLTSAAEPF